MDTQHCSMLVYTFTDQLLALCKFNILDDTMKTYAFAFLWTANGIELCSDTCPFVLFDVFFHNKLFVPNRVI